ncbi:hypothetical protein L596_011587 [Steinernema carpocapsae]|uniref:Uncharacterized protein n=1 Tax=Steinernema carpocapsae TaxID=34508 RepID=A0A4U5NUU0_STECR|nr:hypothetical protein L596_011587 [Steinernema carpocapsae]
MNQACVKNSYHLARLCCGSAKSVVPQRTLLLTAFRHIEEALKMDANNEKAIRLGVKITRALKDCPTLSFQARKRATDAYVEFLEKYIRFEPDDHEARFFRARCSFAILNSPFFLRPLYKAVFFRPPTKSLREIIMDFEEVQRCLAAKDVILIENEFYLALCYIKKGEIQNALRCLEVIDEMECDGRDEQKRIQEKARKLLRKYSVA